MPQRGAKTMSGSKVPSGGSSARDRLRAECEERGVAYPLAFDKLTGSIILCERCFCLVTPERFDEAVTATAELEAADPALKGSVYLASWNEEEELSLMRIGAVQ
jgi:hypothetical protein